MTLGKDRQNALSPGCLAPKRRLVDHPYLLETLEVIDVRREDRYLLCASGRADVHVASVVEPLPAAPTVHNDTDLGGF